MSQVVYFSHSWRHEDTPLNLAVWGHLAGRCRLLVDGPPLAPDTTNPPYYISRIESLLRRSDLFVCCLPSLPRDKWRTPSGDAQGDWRFGRLSPYILFEIRLAERIGIPRLVIYDLESGFRPPSLVPAHSSYISLRFAELRPVLDKGEEVPQLDRCIDAWLAAAGHSRRGDIEPGGLRAGILGKSKSGSRSPIASVREALVHAGIGEVVSVSSEVSNDAEAAELMRSLDLLVADLECTDAKVLYSTAHSHFVPTIRLFGDGHVRAGAELPFLLKGHPAGYQEDLLPSSIDDTVLAEICKRAEATILSGRSIADPADGRRLIRQRTYKHHLIFLSHAAKQDDRMSDDYRRELIDAILTDLDEYGINVWEYDRRNRAGANWKGDMDHALEEMTHFVPMITENYLKRENCRLELEAANRRVDSGSSFAVLPFLVGGRTEACRELRDPEITQKRLPSSTDFNENARTVVETILKSVLR